MMRTRGSSKKKELKTALRAMHRRTGKPSILITTGPGSNWRASMQMLPVTSAIRKQCPGIHDTYNTLIKTSNAKPVIINIVIAAAVEPHGPVAAWR